MKDEDLKKIGVVCIFIALALLALFLTTTFGEEPPHRLVIIKAKEPGGITVVNTDPQAILKLDPWKQPRIGIEAEFNAEYLGIRIVFYFFSRNTKQQQALPAPAHIIWHDGFGGEFALEIENYEHKKIAETVSTSINQETLAQWAAIGPRLTFQMNGWEFRPHELEIVDFRELWYLLEQRQ